MVHVASPSQPISVEDYLELELSSPVRHEFVNGALYALAGASERHNLITGNLYTALRIAARGTTCRIFANDLKLLANRSLFYYPDLMVVCDPTDDDPYSKERPCLIVEVLSPSTERVDRGEKLMAYRGIDSLCAYLIVSQDEHRIVHHWRDDDGAWRSEHLVSEGTIHLPCPDTSVDIATIYEDVPPLPVMQA